MADYSLTTTASSASLSSANVTSRFAYQVYGAISVSLTASDAVLESTHVYLSTSASAFSLVAVDVVVFRDRSPPTLEGAFSFTASDAELSNDTYLVPSAASVSLSSESVLSRYAYQPQVSGSFSLTASDAALDHNFPLTTTEGSSTLTASDAEATVDSPGTLMATTASSVSLTAETVVTRFAYQPQVSGSVSLTASDAILARDRVALETTPSEVSLTASNAEAEVVPLGAMTTLACSFSLTAADCVSRMAYEPKVTGSFSLTAHDAVLRTTGASVIYTYAPAISSELTSSASVLDWNTSRVILTTTASSASLTMTLADYGLDKTTYTYAPAISASLTASNATAGESVVRHIAYAPSISGSLSANAAALTKVSGGVNQKWLLTTASSVEFTAADAKLEQVPLTTEEMSVEFTASDAGLSKTTYVPPGYFLTTLPSSGALTAGDAATFYSQRLLTTTASSASLTAADFALRRARILASTAGGFSLDASRALLTGWWALETTAGSVSLTASDAILTRDARGHRGKGKRHKLGSVSDESNRGTRSRLGAASDSTVRVIRTPLGTVNSE